MDYNKYIGLSYKDNGRDESGVDCWGLAYLFYKQELNITLPSYADLYNGAYDKAVSECIDLYKDTWESTKSGTHGDLCLFNIYNEPAHVGVYIGDSKFLHAREGKDVVIESLTSPQWSKRFQGFFKYNKNSNLVLTTGAPHPFKTNIVQEYNIPGTTVQDLVTSINAKYSISTRLATKLVILIDGEVVPKDRWASTILQAGQTISYKSIAEGRNATRMLLTIAVIYIAGTYGADVGTFLNGGVTTAGSTALGTVAINMAGMALINVIAPIRMPSDKGPNDPGQAASLNLFSGASNQPNRFGAIPVVLGKMRVTGVLGATPYVETLPNTSIINLIVVWGFGPLSITNIQVGTNPIENYYNQAGDTPEFIQNTPLPVTLSGTQYDDFTSFNKLYSRDVEQQQVNVELVNNITDGNPWQNTVLSQTNTTSLDIAFTFPEGMRRLVTKGVNAGEILQGDAYIEIQIRKYNSTGNTWPDWADKPGFTLGDWTKTTGYGKAYSDFIEPISTLDINGNVLGLYQWHTYALSNTGKIVKFSGAATQSVDQEPNAYLISKYKTGSYSSLKGDDADDATYTRLAKLPSSGFVPLYQVCSTTGTVINFLSGYSNYAGLAITVTAKTGPVYWQSENDGAGSYVGGEFIGHDIYITEGALYSLTPIPYTIGATQSIFSTRSMIGSVANVTMFKQGKVGGNVYADSTGSTGWSTFLNEKGVWVSNSTYRFDKTVQVNFPETGVYRIELGVDNYGFIEVSGVEVLRADPGGLKSTVSKMIFLEAGTKSVRIYATNTEDSSAAAIGCAITYTPNSYLNNDATASTVLPFGTPGFYYKTKDAFNFVYKMSNLPEGRYEVRCRKADLSNVVEGGDLHDYTKPVMLSVTGYANVLNANGSPQLPINDIPNTYLAKTALKIQSTSKANGNIDGINAIVQTICYDYDSATTKWPLRSSSNPASLFLHVLLHPGNAYRLSDADYASYVDMKQLAVWHTFCKTNSLEFNNVITSTQSVMDVLRDIAAAGKASPTFVDGKWSVVIDKLRTYVTQHFTPHNSWGFESTKQLPRLPDAFRVTFANEAKAYQADELIVFNYNKTLANAEVFEELRLPGVTSEKQAKHLARWHLAQLKLRPEIYSLSTDFEYLVCTRGDLVRVSHDVPLWGTGTGRLNAVGTNTLGLTEPVYLTAGKTYQIRIRTNNPTVTNASNSTLKQLIPITVSGWYSTITLASNIITADNLEVDNLYMLGEVSKESQELIVLSIEPTTNTSAKITLTDYSPDIYSIDVTSDINNDLPVYSPNITVRSNQAVLNSISQAPIITSALSDSLLATTISEGIYQNVLTLSFGNVSGVLDQAEKIQTQVVLGDTEFTDSLIGAYTIDKSSSTLTITGLKTLTIYKIRSRYTNATGSISGPWCDTVYVTSNGKTDNLYSITDLTIDLEGRYIIVVPTTLSNVPKDVKTYEYRLYKDTGTGDFWDLDVATNNILVSQSLSQGKFNLLDVAIPRISEAGITYRIACRPVDNNNNYGASSALGTIVVKTIQ